MTELKTLKDIDTAKDYTPLSRTYYEDFVEKGDLRAEAIKWLKEDLDYVEEDEFVALLLIERWLNRFNITEKDLKGEQIK
ncbi:MAG TPA: hypothetical protein VI911_04925 [Patescibacteria group bacterium]|nr:hypothetical protein [Patescibacteria group bacterium]